MSQRRKPQILFVQPNGRTVARKTNPPRPQLMLTKIISDFLGKDERRIMFRKVKGVVYMFVINSKSIKKIHLKENPKTYPMKEFENLGAFLYKLNREKKDA